MSSVLLRGSGSGSQGQSVRGPAAGIQVAETGRPRSGPSAIVEAWFVSRDHGHDSSVDRTSTTEIDVLVYPVD